MIPGHGDARIHGHIRAIAGRSPADADLMLEILRRAGWPAGAADRTDARTRDWLRRWRAARGTVMPPPCRCGSGTCRSCN